MTTHRCWLLVVGRLPRWPVEAGQIQDNVVVVHTLVGWMAMHHIQVASNQMVDSPPGNPTADTQLVDDHNQVVVGNWRLGVRTRCLLVASNPPLVVGNSDHWQAAKVVGNCCIAADSNCRDADQLGRPTREDSRHNAADDTNRNVHRTDHGSPIGVGNHCTAVGSKQHNLNQAAHLEGLG